MPKKQITIEALARMVQKGFEETAKGFEETAKKREINHQFGEVYRRFDKIENLIIVGYNGRIEKLEVQMEGVRDALAMK
ncbi:MAG: hypothetical protein Q7S79_03685 [bacterium]|nr:hypothetical protein [bacterium]